MNFAALLMGPSADQIMSIRGENHDVHGETDTAILPGVG